MSTQVKRRRGTASDNASFTGALGEIVAITDTQRIALHNAATAGGKTFLNATDIQNKVGTGDATVGGTGNAITLTHSFPRTAHTNGAEIQFKATADNSGAVTVAIDSIPGTKALEKMVNGTSTALSTGDIKNGVIYLARYDGTRYQLQTGGATAIVSVNRQIFTTSGTYTPSAGMVYCIIECVGGGGGGGSNSTASAGGGGETAISIKTAAQVGASQTVTVGAKGTKGTGSIPTAPTAGGDTSVGTLVIAKGGNAGSNTNDSNANAGGTGGTGDILIAGGYGSRSIGSGLGAFGGNSTKGQGAPANATTTLASVGYGAGGAALGSTSPSNDGTDGVVYITEFCSQ